MSSRYVSVNGVIIHIYCIHALVYYFNVTYKKTNATDQIKMTYAYEHTHRIRQVILSKNVFALFFFDIMRL